MSSDTLPNQDAGGEASAPADDALRQERDDYRDRLLRTTAEFDNYRKRTERERRELAEYATADLIRDLLPVIDDLDRALDAVEATGGQAQLTPFRSGVDMVRRQLLDVLQRRGVAAIETVGRQFDPSWHEALAAEPAGDRSDGLIVAEIRRGYRMGDRLLRAAMVKVTQS
jgi:molecular chaperone GrpE